MVHQQQVDDGQDGTYAERVNEGQEEDDNNQDNVERPPEF